MSIEPCLYIILSRDVPILKSDFFLRSEFSVGLSVGIFRDAEESNIRARTDGFLTGRIKRRALSNMRWHAFEHSLSGKTRLWLKETEKNKNLRG